MSQANETALAAVKTWLRETGNDAFAVFSGDEHGSEYTVAHDRLRAYLSGFTGSAGTLIITPEEVCLWTDGRYFLQAEAQLSGSSIRLMREGEPGVPSVCAYLRGKKRVATDFRLATAAFRSRLAAVSPETELVDEPALADTLWPDRPPMPDGVAFPLPDRRAGRSAAEKLAVLRQDMAKEGADWALVTALDDVAWLLNLRGTDLPHTPVAYAFVLVGADSLRVYLDEAKRDARLTKALRALGAELRERADVYREAAALKGVVLLDQAHTNLALLGAIQQPKAVAVFPTARRKAVKNPAEIRGMKEAHAADGVAMVRFLYRLKADEGSRPLSELSAGALLEELRRDNSTCTDLSFETICGYGPHGAIVHYGATPETDAEIRPEGLLLVDSGGQYTTGTTDITRTVVMGRLTREEKRAFTLVLKAHIALASAVFPEGTRGDELDLLTREPLYRELLDYRHGTGHGVGWRLCVHEGPPRIARVRSEEASLPLEAGMITSDEPGIYVDGRFGVRHENLLLCVPAGVSPYGRFLRFEPLTLVPFDRAGILPSLLTKSERDWLNRYHRLVYRTLAPRLRPAEARFLARLTKAL